MRAVHALYVTRCMPLAITARYADTAGLLLPEPWWGENWWVLACLENQNLSAPPPPPPPLPNELSLSSGATKSLIRHPSLLHEADVEAWYNVRGLAACIYKTTLILEAIYWDCWSGQIVKTARWFQHGAVTFMPFIDMIWMISFDILTLHRVLLGKQINEFVNLMCGWPCIVIQCG